MLGKRILYAIWVLFVLAFWITQGTFLSVVFLWATVLLTAASAADVFLARKRLRIEILAPARMKADKKKSFRIVLKNNSPAPAFCVRGEIVCSNLVTNEEKVFPVAMGALPKKEDTVTCKIRSEHCGCVEVRARKICCTDLLGILSAPLPESAVQMQQILIIPASYEMEALPVTAGGSMRAGIVPGEERFGVREYQEGEKLSNIHWKASSKLDRLMVREQPGQSNDVAAIYLETVIGTEEPAAFAVEADRRVKKVLALSHACCEKGISHDVVFYREREDVFAGVSVRLSEDFGQVQETVLRTVFVSGIKPRYSRFLQEWPQSYTDVWNVSEQKELPE